MFTPQDNLKQSALALIDGESNVIANLANLSSLFFYSLPDLNWAGFYLWDVQSEELVLGPFQGKPACIRIKPNRGVCGQAYRTKQSQLVPDVHQFADHIACDAETRSELVIPLIRNGEVIGVLDLDSPKLNRFSISELLEIEEVMKSAVAMIWK